jgi:hypothetical protein
MQQLSHEDVRIALRCRKRRTTKRPRAESGANQKTQGRHMAALAFSRE